MKMFRISPVVRLSIGLSLLTVSLLLVADFLGFIPNQKLAEFGARKVISESLAVQVSADVARGDIDSVAALMHALQKRNTNILSIGLRTQEEQLISSAGDHLNHWQLRDEESSTITNIKVPIHDKNGRWGTLEVSFQPLDGNSSIFARAGSIVTIAAFILTAGFFVYWLFLKRALNELDPSAVIPDRVSAALNILAEGLVILDNYGRIVFVNTAFEQKIGQPAEVIVGTNLDELDWESADAAEANEQSRLPWQLLLDGFEAKHSHLKLCTSLKEYLSFAVNIAPIQAPDGKVRGVVVTFDDVTELESKNIDLESALGQIKQSQQEIKRQNSELQVLATRDPMTGLLNRRSLFEGAAAVLSEIENDGETLSCIMLDIDHFKLVNDRFGHAVGDKVIKLLAQILAETARSGDLVGRYGGEEFCIILPGVDEHLAAEIAERIRLVVNKVKSDESTGIIPFTASFGVASVWGGKFNPEFIIDLADKALYHAKESGRNQVARWSIVEHINKISKHSGESNAAIVSPISCEQKLSTEFNRTENADEQKLHHRIAELETLIYSQKIHEIEVKKEPSTSSNQIVIFDRIKQAIERSLRLNTLVAVLLIDVDSIQVVKNTLGNSKASQLTSILAKRLKGVLRSVDSIVMEDELHISNRVSQTSNGEFVVLLMDIKKQEEVTWVNERLFTAISEPVALDDTEVYLDARIGVSVYPSDGKNPEVLLSNAGVALGEAKSTIGKNICLYYCKEMNERAQTQLYMKAELHKAINLNELYVEYQPVISMSTGQITSFEALLRWRHPELGLVSPEILIPIAEHAGLIEEIGDWVLEKACRQLKAWRDIGHNHLTVAVNFSALQFRNPEFANKVMFIVNQTGLTPNALTMEITESALIHNLELTELHFNQLSNAGVRISLDDFGTGYSSLSYLKVFPIDIVKIDKSFLHGFPEQIHDSSIVRAMLAMVHNLGLHVVTEGVEHHSQLQALQNLNSDSIQGYLFSKPISPDQATALLESPANIRHMVWSTKPSQVVVNNSLLTGILNHAPKRGSVA